MAERSTNRTNYIFVDYENVHKVDLAVFNGKTNHLTLLLGSQQKSLDAALVEKLLEHAGEVEMIRLASPGKNALDFALAYYVGKAVAADPAGSFHIVSQDKGYGPLIEHLKTRKISIQRHDDFAALRGVKPAKTKRSTVTITEAPKPQQQLALPVPAVTDEKAIQILASLSKMRREVWPRTQGTLIGFVRGQLGPKTTKEEATQVVQNLRRDGCVIGEEKGPITYDLKLK